MPMFFRGAGLNTYWHEHDARLTGFLPHHPGAEYGISRILAHIARGSTASPFISLTRSYGVARGYALAGKVAPTAATPAYVYEVDIGEELKRYGTRLVDPVQEIAKSLGSPYELRSYQHDGDASFVLGVADPKGHYDQLAQRVVYPPPGQGAPRSPLLGIQLESLVNAIRDAEVLVFGAIPASQVVRRIECW
jgi:hypothetical protein